MGYSLTGKFINTANKQIISEADVDFLKNINERRYDFESDYLKPSLNSDEVLEYVEFDYYEFLGGFKDFRNDIACVPYDDGYVIEDEALLEPYKLPEKDEVVVGAYIKKRYRPSRYYAFTYQDVENGRKEVEEKYNLEKEKLSNLENIESSIEYYKLDNDGKDCLLEDIASQREYVEDLTYSKSALTNLESVFDYFKSHAILTYEGKNYYPWEGKRNIIFIIEVW